MTRAELEAAQRAARGLITGQVSLLGDDAVRLLCRALVEHQAAMGLTVDLLAAGEALAGVVGDSLRNARYSNRVLPELDGHHRAVLAWQLTMRQLKEAAR